MEKILFLMRDFRMGGGEKLTLSLLHHLDRRRFKALVVAVDEMGPLRSGVPADIPVINLHGKQGNALQFPFRILRYSIRLQKIIDSEKPGIVISDNWFAGMLACSAVRSIHKYGKLIVEFHLPVNAFIRESTFSNIFAPIKRAITSRFFRKADRVIAISKLMAEELRLQFSIERDKIALIYNGVDLKRIQKMSLSVMPGRVQSPYIVTIGRLTPEKGYETLLAAYKNIASKIPHSLVIVGEGRQRIYLEALTQRYSLKERVFFTGVLENPFKLMKKADFLVLPSRWEAFPTVLLEALALEVPIIATRCDGPIEILDNGQFGLLVPPDDIRCLSEAILKFAFHHDRRDEYRSKSRSRAEKYSLERMVDEYEKLFSALLENTVL